VLKWQDVLPIFKIFFSRIRSLVQGNTDTILDPNQKDLSQFKTLRAQIETALKSPRGMEVKQYLGINLKDQEITKMLATMCYVPKLCETLNKADVLKPDWSGGHAEIRVIHKVEQTGRLKENFYLGISKTCCPKCTGYLYGMYSQKPTDMPILYRTGHAASQQNWTLPNNEEKHLERAIGAALYEKYITIGKVEPKDVKQWIEKEQMNVKALERYEHIRKILQVKNTHTDNMINNIIDTLECADGVLTENELKSLIGDDLFTEWEKIINTKEEFTAYIRNYKWLSTGSRAYTYASSGRSIPIT